MAARLIDREKMDSALGVEVISRMLFPLALAVLAIYSFKL